MSMFMLVTTAGVVAATLVVVVVSTAWRGARRQASAFGYPSVSAYLQATPRSDATRST